MERSSSTLRWGALFASIALPGAGHAIVGHANRATAWVAAFFVVMVASAFAARWWLGALVVGFAVASLLYVTCCIDAYRVAAIRGHPSVVAWVVLGLAAFVSFLVLPILVPIVIRIGALEAFKTPQAAMCPSIAVGDHFFVDKTAYRFASPKRGDIVVYEGPGVHPPADFVHRVVAAAGDEVRIDQGALTVNGKAPATTATGRNDCDGMRVFEEDLGTRHPIALDPDAVHSDFRMRVPPDTVFVMGDNRDNAHDSRHKGAVPLDHIRGRLWRRWMCGPNPCWNEVP
jgi:signal peptidase I